MITLYLESSHAQIDLDPDDRNGATDHTLSLLAPDIDTFYSSIPALIRPFSNLLSTAVTDLRSIANAGTNSTVPHPTQSSSDTHPVSRDPSRPRLRVRQNSSKTAPQPLISAKLNDRLLSLREIQLSGLPSARREIAVMAAGVLAMRAEVLERTVVILERTKHGALARATKAKAEHLATVAEAIDGKLRYV
jgi:diphthamide biosynthesis protein 3